MSVREIIRQERQKPEQRSVGWQDVCTLIDAVIVAGAIYVVYFCL